MQFSAYKSMSRARLMGLVVGLMVSLLSLSCSQESSEDSQIAAGLKCLDTAKSNSDADDCLAKIEGLTSAKSSLLRCSANMIAQGFTGSRIASAFQKLKDNGSNGTASMLAYFVFAKPYTNHTADKTLSNCTASGVQALIFLATMIKTATYAASLTGSLDGSTYDPSAPGFNPAALQTQLTNLYNSNDPTANATIGNLATTAQTTYCGTGSTFSTQDVCNKLNSAISSGAGNAADIGRALLNLLKN